MSILINWTNPSQSADNIIIYRATAPFDGSNLPTVMATLPATDVAYEDTTNLLNAVYYYRIGRAVGSDIVLSKQLALSERANMGPGSNELIRGDYDTGYFGDVTADELFTTEALSTELSYTAGWVATSTPNWRKFIHDGKIKFIPNTGLRTAIGNWATLYNQGLVYGSDDAGAHAALAPVLQDRRVSKDGYTYKVRTIKIHGKSSQELPGAASKDTTPDSEFAELITRLLTDNVVSGATRWNDRTKLLSTSLSILVPSQMAHTAGLNGTTTYSLHASNPVYANSLTGVNSQMTWLPVLELED